VTKTDQDHFHTVDLTRPAVRGGRDRERAALRIAAPTALLLVWARSRLNCVGSHFVQTGNGRLHIFPPYEKNEAFICSSLEPHLRQWTRGGSADSASKSSSTVWTTVDETDRDLFAITRFLGIEIRLAIAGTRLLKTKVRCAAERCFEQSGRKSRSNLDLAQSVCSRRLWKALVRG
jgi:hypothetical protein